MKEALTLDGKAIAKQLSPPPQIPMGPKKGFGSPEVQPTNFFNNNQQKSERNMFADHEHNRRISLTGDMVHKKEDSSIVCVLPSDPCLPQGTKLFARRRSVGNEKTTTKRKSFTEHAVQHFESTFTSSVMILTDRLNRLEHLLSVKHARPNKIIEDFQYLVTQISSIAIQLSRIAKAFDKSIKIDSLGLCPDSVEEGIAQAKFVTNKLIPYYETIVSHIRLSRSNNVSLDLVFDGSVFKRCDQDISNAVKIIATISSLASEK